MRFAIRGNLEAKHLNSYGMPGIERPVLHFAMGTGEDKSDAGQNPYEVSAVKEGTADSRRKGTAAFYTFLVVMIIPASVATFCCTCSATGAAGVAIGGLGSGFSLFCYLAAPVLGFIAARAVAIRLQRAIDRAKRKRESKGT